MDLCVLSFRSFASDAQCFVFKYFLNEFRKWILLLFIIPFGTGPLVLQTILYFTYIYVSYKLFCIFWLLHFFSSVNKWTMLWYYFGGKFSVSIVVTVIVCCWLQTKLLNFWTFFFFSLTRTSDFIRVINLQLIFDIKLHTLLTVQVIFVPSESNVLYCFYTIHQLAADEEKEDE